MAAIFLIVAASAVVGITAFCAGAYLGGRRAAKKHQNEFAEADKNRSALLQAASHELRTPLNNILGLIDNLQDRANASDLSPQKTLEQLSQSANALHKMLLDVSEIFLLWEGKLKLEADCVNLKALQEEVIGLYRGMIARQGVQVELNSVADRDIWVETDPVRVRQCLTTLIKQAVYQTRSGMVSVRLDAKGAADGQSAAIVFSVSDHSDGAPQEIADKYFSPQEYNFNPYLSGRPAAMLAINLAKSVAEQLGGKLEARSAIGAGVTFQFSLNAKLASPRVSAKLREDMGPDDKRASAEQNDKSAFAEARVLIVDDNETNLLVLENMLKTFQFSETVKARSGREAIRCAFQDKFDLILMDLQMPEMDGLEATKQIRRVSEHYAQAPIIAVSACSRIVNEDICRKTGMNGFVEKPYSKDVLHKAIYAVAPSIAKLSKAKAA